MRIRRQKKHLFVGILLLLGLLSCNFSTQGRSSRMTGEGSAVLEGTVVSSREERPFAKGKGTRTILNEDINTRMRSQSSTRTVIRNAAVRVGS
nr:hypothetical protein LKV13_04795 [Borrelia sp. BU AG58]